MDNVALEIIERVDSFYSASFSQLITLTLGIIAFAGVFVPILTTYYQNRKINIEKKNLEDQIKAHIEQLKEKIAEETKREMLQELARFEAKLEKASAGAIAGVLHVQANLHLGKSQYNSATNSILSGIENCILAEDELNLCRGIKMLIERCLPKLDKKEDPNLENLEVRISRLCDLISGLNANGRYTDMLADLQAAHKKTASRLLEKEMVEQ